MNFTFGLNTDSQATLKSQYTICFSCKILVKETLPSPKIVVSPEKQKNNNVPGNTYFLCNVSFAKINLSSELIIVKNYIQDKMTKKSNDPNYNSQELLDFIKALCIISNDLHYHNYLKERPQLNERPLRTSAPLYSWKM